MFEIGKKGTPEAGPRPESSPARMDSSPPRSSAPVSREAAVIGASISWLMYNGNTVTLGDSTGSIVFNIQITPTLLLLGVLLFHAQRAMRLLCRYGPRG